MIGKVNGVVGLIWSGGKCPVGCGSVGARWLPWVVVPPAGPETFVGVLIRLVPSQCAAVCPVGHRKAGCGPLHQVPSAFLFGQMLWLREHLPGQAVCKWCRRQTCWPDG